MQSQLFQENKMNIKRIQTASRRWALSVVSAGLVFSLALAFSTAAWCAGSGFPIGVEGVPECGKESSWLMADELGLNFIMYWSSWAGCTPRSYSWSSAPGREEFREHLRRLKGEGYTVALTDTTVHMTEKHLPGRFDGRRLDDPEVLAAWEDHLRDVLSLYGPYIDYFHIGNEIDIYYGMHPDEWPEYEEFFKRGAAVIRAYDPGIKIGVVLMAKTAEGKYWDTLKGYCDFLSVTYYVPCSMSEPAPVAEGLEPDNPRYFATEFGRAFERAGDKPVLIIEVGCATHPKVDSTPELQAKFIRLLFEWLPGKEDKLLGMLWLNGQDWPFDRIAEILEGELMPSVLASESFKRYLTSLGLLDENGHKKPGYWAFKEEMAAYRAGKDEVGFESLFDGKTLAGWVVEPKPDAMEMYGVEGGTKDSFGVADGTIARLSGGYSWIRSEETYGDFVLSCEYKISEGGNSGIHFRVGDPKDEVFTGIEMQILDDQGKPAGIHSCGAIYDVLAPRVNASKPAGEWNDVTITCIGSRIRIELNGTRVIDMNLDEWTAPVGKFKTAYAEMPRAGYIGFQNHGDDVWFRNVRIKRVGK